MVLDQKWVVNSIPDVKIEFGHIWSLNATIFQSVDKNGISNFSRTVWGFKCDDLLIHITQAIHHWKVWSLSFHWKKINVMWPKLIEIERNENLKIFHFFKKNQHFFKFWKSPEKTAPGAVFFLKSWFNFKTSQNRFKTFSEVAEGIVRKVWLHTLWFWGFKCDDFTLCEIVAFKSQERSFLTSKARDLLIWKLKIVAFKDEMCNHHSEVWNTWTTPKSYHPFNMVTLFTLLVLKCDDLLHSQKFDISKFDKN